MSACKSAQSKKKALPTKKQSSPKKEESSKKEFIWSDDEVELLLSVTHEYKVKKAAESTDWESIRSKYKDIFELFVAALPQENNDMRDFPHRKEEIKLANITSKLKGIRLKFRQAVDDGRHSGHGRVVMIYYELCEKIWGGSPATEQIDGGVETVELNNSMSKSSESNGDGTGSTSGDFGNGDMGNSNTGIDDTGNCDTGIDDIDTGNSGSGDAGHSTTNAGTSTSTDEHQQSDDETNTTVINKRRQLLDETLKNYRQNKLKRRLPVDAQILNHAQEELTIKKRLVEQIDIMDRRYAENVEKMSQNMEKITSSIADGFTFLKQFMMYQQPAPMYHSQPYPYMQGSYPPSSNTHASANNQPYDTYQE